MRLRSHLILLVFACLFPVLVFTAIVVVMNVSAERAAAERGVRETVRAISVAVNKELERTIAIAQGMARSADLTAGDLPGFYQYARAAIGDQPHISSVALLDLSGRQLLNLSRPFGAPLPEASDRAFFDRTIASGKPEVSDLSVGKVFGTWQIAINVPVLREGRMRYILGVAIRPEALGDILLRQRLPAEWIGGINDRRGIIIARTRAAHEFVGKPASPLMRARSGQAPEGWFRNIGIEGRPIYSAFSRSELSGWTVALSLPARTIEAPLWRSLAVAATGGGVALLLGLGFAALLGRRIARDVTGLATAAKALGRGEALPAKPPAAVREVTEVERAMADARSLLHQRSVERDQVEAALRASEARYRRLVDANIVGIAFSRADGRIVEGNDEFLRIAGVSRGAVRNGTARWDKCTPPEYMEVSRRLTELVRQHGVCPPFEKEYVHPDGRRVPVLVAAARLEGTDEHVAFVLDLSERKRAQRERDELLAREQAVRAQAEAANRAKDEFLAMLGHELRNPLGAISNAVQILTALGGPDDRGAHPRAIIARQVEHLARLMDDLLDVARVTTGKVLLARQPLDLGQAVSHGIAGLRASRAAERHVLAVEVQPVWIHADRTRVDQIVNNLLMNAMKYTPPGGTIAVRVGPEGADAVLRVQDSGVGIPAQLLPRVFDLFVQGERAPDRAQGGLGIGLTLVRHLVELHGGTVQAASPGPGQGSTFTVRLPALPAPVAARPTPPGHPEHDAPRRILIVEDNKDSRDSLRILLELAGHRVTEAPDGPSAVEVARREPPEVALIDIGLPGLDGYEVARRIRGEREGQAVFLVALTGYGQAEDRRRAQEAGFDAHLVKPVDPDRLAQLLRTARKDPSPVPR